MAHAVVPSPLVIGKMWHREVETMNSRGHGDGQRRTAEVDDIGRRRVMQCHAMLCHAWEEI